VDSSANEYLQIADDLRRRSDAAFSPLVRPCRSESELMERYAVASGTVRKAVAECARLS